MSEQTSFYYYTQREFVRPFLSRRAAPPSIHLISIASEAQFESGLAHNRAVLTDLGLILHKYHHSPESATERSEIHRRALGLIFAFPQLRAAADVTRSVLRRHDPNYPQILLRLDEQVEIRARSFLRTCDLLLQIPTYSITNADASGLPPPLARLALAFREWYATVAAVWSGILRAHPGFGDLSPADRCEAFTRFGEGLTSYPGLLAPAVNAVHAFITQKERES